MSKIENPYLDNRKVWNEIIGQEKANAVMWRLVAFISMGITTIAVVGIIYAAQLPDVVPFLFKENGAGGITALGIPNTAYRPDNKIIANQLAEYVSALRQVPLADELRRRNVHRVKMMTDNNLFNSQVAQMMREEYADIGSGEQLIDIKTIMPVAKNVWQIDWIEIKNGITTGRYKATVNYVQNPQKFKDPEEMLWNPVGILIKDINVNRVIGS